MHTRHPRGHVPAFADSDLPGVTVSLQTAQSTYKGFAADCLQPPVRRSISCNIPIAEGKDSEDILGAAAHLNPKGRGDQSLPTKPGTERRR
jgi:hypothetical protein